MASARTPARRAETEIAEAEPEPVDFSDNTIALAAATRAEVDAQVATAKRYPRSIKRFLIDAETIATLSSEVAQDCIYSLPRGNKPITGPSVRFAEIVAMCWKNIRTSTRIVSIESNFVVAEAICMDLESNVGFQAEARRRITDSKGRRYNDDMIGVTAAAALSIAARNAIFRVVPKALWNHVYEAAKRLAIGEGDSVEQLREMWLTTWEKKGVKRHEVFQALGVQGEPDITLGHIETLIGFQTAIKEGLSSLDDIFRPAPQVSSQGTERKPGESKTDALSRRLGGGKPIPPSQQLEEPEPFQAPIEEPRRVREPGEEG
jgi:hypothetical protein